MTTTHGGPRPKQRDDDGRVNNRPTVHLGRKPSTFTLKLGDVFWVGMSNPEGKGVIPGEIWTVAEITRSHVVLVSDTGYKRTLVR